MINLWELNAEEINELCVMGLDEPEPTYGELLNFDGGHYYNKWNWLSEDWFCKACKRNKKQIVRKIYKFGEWKLSWQVAKHHDHGTDYGLFRRFWPTYVCALCNTVEGAIKRKLKLPEFFSFSPWELNKIIKATPHQKHKFCYEEAKNIFKYDVYPKLSISYKKDLDLWYVNENKMCEKELFNFRTECPGGIYYLKRN